MLKLIARDEFVYNGLAFMLVELNGNGDVCAFSQDVTMKRLPLDIRGVPVPGDPPSGPAFRLHRDQCQALVDQLWAMGIRPIESGSSVGALGQAESHIASLREVTRALLPK